MPELARDEKGGPEPRKGVRFLWFAVAIVVAAGASGGGVYVYTQYATHLAVTGINWQVFVNNTSMGYVFNSEASGCQAQCPANAQVNSVWIYTLVFAYGTAEYNLSVVNVTLPQPFFLLGISPSVPKELAAGSGSVSFRIAIQLPANPGSYSVLGAVWVASGPGNPAVRLVSVQTGLAWPIALAFASDGRVFYAERNTGAIRIIENGAVLPTPFFTLPNTATAGERGLLGLALDPGFPGSPWVYAYQTYNDAANGTTYNRIVRVQASGNAGVSSSVILRMPPLSGATNHNGGVIAFGPDGRLWAVVGENANPSLAQNSMSPLGKVLRMDSDGNAASDNPFYGSLSWENRVYTYGHRNMFGLAWHPVTGGTYVTENGPNCNDEVNLLTAANNYGWGPSETCTTPPTPPANTNQDGPSPVMPIDWWASTIAPTNAAFFTGPLLPQSRNHLMFGAYNDHRLRELALTSDGTAVVNESLLLTAPDAILDVEMGLDGYLWVTTPTTIYRVEATPTIVPYAGSLAERNPPTVLLLSLALFVAPEMRVSELGRRL